MSNGSRSSSNEDLPNQDLMKNVTFERGSAHQQHINFNEDNESLNDSVNDYFEETYDTFETVVIEHVAPIKDGQQQPSLDNVDETPRAAQQMESQSKSSFNDFEYWNRSISNIDSLLMLDPLNHDELHCEFDEINEDDDDEEENIYANDSKNQEFEFQIKRPDKR